MYQKLERRRRIVFLLPSAYAGGSERVFFNLLQNFDRRYLELYLILVNPSGPYLELVPPDIGYCGLGHKRVGTSLLRLVATLRKLKPHVVLSSICHMNLSLLLVKPLLPKNTKVFIRESNIPSFALASGAKLTLFRLLYRILYPGADRIICPGEAIKKDLHKNFGIRIDKMVTIPNPVNVDTIRAKLRADESTLNSDKVNLLAAGGLTRQKGFDLLIQAMATLVKIKPEIHLTILGNGPENDNLLNQIRSLDLFDSVTLAGFQQNPYPCFYHADLFVLPSRWEGLPNVVLESLACGTPVVAFDCPGSVGEIFDKSSQGTLVPAGDVEGLARVIGHRLQNQTSRAKDSLLPARFESKSVTEKYEQLLSGS